MHIFFNLLKNRMSIQAEKRFLLLERSNIFCSMSILFIQNKHKFGNFILFMFYTCNFFIP